MFTIIKVIFNSVFNSLYSRSHNTPSINDISIIKHTTTAISSMTKQPTIINDPLYRRMIKNDTITTVNTISTELPTYIDVVAQVFNDTTEFCGVTIPAEIISNEIALHLPFSGLRSLCMTTRENSVVCNDLYFLERWVEKHPDDTSDMMEWLALRGRWSIFKVFMRSLKWDAKSKKLASLYLTEERFRGVHPIDVEIEQYLMRYWSVKPTAIMWSNFCQALNNLPRTANQVQIQKEVQKLELYITTNAKDIPTLIYLPELYIGNRILEKFNAERLHATFSNPTTSNSLRSIIFGVKQAIIAALINAGNVTLLRELLMIIYIPSNSQHETLQRRMFLLKTTINDSMRKLFFKYASASTYMSMYDIFGKINQLSSGRDSKRPELVRLLLTNVKGHMPYSEIEPYHILSSVVPLEFDASEFIDLCLKYPHKNYTIKHNFPRDIYDLLIVGEERRARVFVDELTRRGLPYKYENTSCD